MDYPTIIKGTQEPLSSRYSLALLDLDGVVYRGAHSVENAAEGIRKAENAGMHIAYTTNNPSRYPAQVAEQIRSFGIGLEDSDIITSAMVSAHMLKEALGQGGTVLVVGKDHLKDELRKAGLEVCSRAADRPQAVIQSWYPDISWKELAQASYAVNAGARYFATNRDLTIPREEGIAPGNGALIRAVSIATGKGPEASAGKPEAHMYHIARDMFSPAGSRVPVEECLPVGDRLDTDIEAANRGGYDSAVVLTGVADARQIIQAQPLLRPSYICADLKGLNNRHPQVVCTDSIRHGQGISGVSFICGDTLAYVRGEALTVEISGQHVTGPISSLDALRAAASAAWDAADNHDADLHNLQIPQFSDRLQ